jgi:hypothetical protein
LVTYSGTDPAVRRRRVVALILSGIFPGLGQLYNRQRVKGVIGLALSWLAGRATPTDPRAVAQPPAALLAPLCALLAVWLWSIIDAWRTAGR